MVKYAKHEWVEEYPGAITVCDTDGIVLELNLRSAEVFQPEGGMKLIGSNLMDCHPAGALRKLKPMMKNRETNVYTVRKGRTRKIVLQTPWYRKGKYRGFVEISLPITGKIPDIVREPS